MNTKLIAFIFYVCFLIFFSACTHQEHRPSETQSVKADDTILLTDATQRMVFRDKNGICAEPSPDVAQAFSTSLSAGLSAAMSKLPADASAEVAASFASSAVENVAQLGERLATIQLLRDGLYRACEAHARGALSNASYAVPLSRYDDVMITALSTEVAGGAFGRSLAGISGESTGDASATLTQKSEFKSERKLISDIKESLDRHQEFNSTMNNLIEQNGTFREQLAEVTAANTDGSQDQQEASLKQNIDATTKSINTLKATLDKNRQETENLHEKLDTELESKANVLAKGTTTEAGSIIPGKQTKEIAEILEEIQKNYVENINSDAIRVACITALTGKDSNSKLAQVCKDQRLFTQASETEEKVFNSVMAYKTKQLTESSSVAKILAEAELAKQRAKVLAKQVELLILEAKAKKAK